MLMVQDPHPDLTGHVLLEEDLERLLECWVVGRVDEAVNEYLLAEGEAGERQPQAGQHLVLPAALGQLRPQVASHRILGDGGNCAGIFGDAVEHQKVDQLVGDRAVGERGA